MVEPDERWLKSNQDAMDIFNEANVEFEYFLTDLLAEYYKSA